MFDGSPVQTLGLPLRGDTLAGKYEIVRLLGEGGMAYVYEANHRRLGQRVAIKLLAPAFASDAELVARFEREARAVAKLRTPHVVRVTDVDATDTGVPFIVMEFLEGRDLDAELSARRALPVQEAVDYVLQACAAMLEAHGNGIVHRDLKPANLFLANEGAERIVKVLDFGISKILGEATRLTGAGAVMGTVLYMSPEQVRASSNVDARADIWSLGVILFELIAGRAPFEGSSPQIAAAIVSRDAPDLRSFASVPDGLAAVVRQMLERDVARRPPDVRSVIASLAPFARAGSVGAAIGEQVSLGQSGARVRPSLPNPLASGQTMPLVPQTPRGGPPSGDRSPLVGPALGAPTAPLHAVPTPRGQAPSPSYSRERAAPPRTLGDKGRVVILVAILLGLLGAAGVVLIAAAKLRPPRPRSPSASISAEAPPAPSAASPALSASGEGPAPAATSSTTSEASAKPQAAPSPKSAPPSGGRRAPSAPSASAPATNPKLL
jgi:serine/threonine-protein kinase